MKEELIIETDGYYERLDLGSDTGITLKYNSNIFSDISKINSNRSYTVKVPITSNNKRIVDNAELPHYESRFTHRKHYAQYFKNGLQIVKNALAVLLATSDVYELALIWGNVSRFSDMVGRGESLNDLSGNDFIVWNKQMSGIDHGNFFIPLVDNGIRYVSDSNINENVYYHPAVKVSWILDKIQADNNIVLLFPDDKKEFINRLMIPLIDKEGSKELMNESPIKLDIFAASSTEQPRLKGLDLKFVGESTESKYGKITLIHVYTWRNVYGYRVLHDSEESNLYGNIVIRIDRESIPSATGVHLHINKLTNNNEIKYIDELPPSYVSGTDTSFELTYSMGSNFSIEKDETIFLGIGYKEYLEDVVVNVTNIYANIELRLSPRDEVYTGERYPIAANLPNIKQIDFIKAICSMLGLFAIPVEGSNNTIRLVTLDIIYNNKSKAYDWSNKLIKAGIGSTPREMTFSLSDFARVNYFKYKEDDTVNGNYDGEIRVSDDSLDKEKDMVTLPFAGSDTLDGKAVIPLYSYKNNDDGTKELEYSQCQPRILLEENNNGMSKGVFTGLSFADLLDNNYNRYREVVNSPKVIKEDIYLSNYELMTLDLTIPVYLSQYARYYAIVTIEAHENNKCECKLLQL
jgi:hypothetical protein